MKVLLKLENIAFLVLAVATFAHLEYAWWVYPAWFLVPDVSMVGYLSGPKAGAALYNLAHHKGVAVAACLGGVWLGSDPLLLAGSVLLGHSAFDRVLGFGLKYPDAFAHTHLDEIA
jgi:hypothetical protein